MSHFFAIVTLFLQLCSTVVQIGVGSLLEQRSFIVALLAFSIVGFSFPDSLFSTHPTVTTALSPSLSTTTMVYPQDITTELHFWETLMLLQPTHTGVLYNQYILLQADKRASAPVLYSQVIEIDPQFFEVR